MGKRKQTELKLELESTLAAFLLQEAKVFLPLLNTIGNELNDYLYEIFFIYKQTNKEDEFYHKIGGIYKSYLFNNKAYFGRFDLPQNAPSNREVYNIARQHLVKGKAIEHILTCFLATLAVFEYLTTQQFNEHYLARFNQLGKTLFSNELFAHRNRYHLPDKPPLRNDIGIFNGYNPHVKFKIQSHTKAADSIRFDSKYPTFFQKNAVNKDLPLVAGPSSHCAGLLRIALLFFDFSDDPELSLQYINCICAFLIAAGAHSHHEILSVAKNIGVPYQDGNYLNSLSFAFQNTPSFQKFKEIYLMDAHSKQEIEEHDVDLDGRPETKLMENRLSF